MEIEMLAITIAITIEVFFSLQIGKVFLTLWKLGCWHARLGHLLAEDVPGGISQHASQKVFLFQRISCLNCLNCYNSLRSKITAKNICFQIFLFSCSWKSLQPLAKYDMVWWCFWQFLSPHRYTDLRIQCAYDISYFSSDLILPTQLFLVGKDPLYLRIHFNWGSSSSNSPH